jgi:acyl carrier protein
MELVEQIKTFILSNFYVANPATIEPEASLLDAGIIDSTGVLEIVSFLESTFSISLADEEIVPENFDSIGRIARFVARKQAQ